MQSKSGSQYTQTMGMGLLIARSSSRKWNNVNSSMQKHNRWYLNTSWRNTRSSKKSLRQKKRRRKKNAPRSKLKVTRLRLLMALKPPLKPKISKRRPRINHPQTTKRTKPRKRKRKQAQKKMNQQVLIKKISELVNSFQCLNVLFYQ